jgi:hypothetical protein
MRVSDAVLACRSCGSRRAGYLYQGECDACFAATSARKEKANSRIRSVGYCAFFLAVWAILLPAEIRLFYRAFPDSGEHAFILACVACALVAGLVANKKGRDAIPWFMAGAFFLLPALFVFCVDDITAKRD